MARDDQARRAGDRAAGDRRQLREARPAHADAEPGDVRRRGRQRPHDVPVLPRPRPSSTATRTCSPASSRCSCGSPCCSRTSPRRWPRAAARRRPTRCARRGRRRSRTCGSADGIDRGRARARRSTSATCASSTAGEIIPGDGDVVEGIASVDESAITGESAPVIRESGGDRSAVTGGTRVLSDEIVVHITPEPGETFLDRMIALVEGRRAPEDAERDRAQHPARRASRSSSCSRRSRCSRSRSSPTPSRRSSCSSRCSCA